MDLYESEMEENMFQLDMMSTMLRFQENYRHMSTMEITMCLVCIMRKGVEEISNLLSSKTNSIKVVEFWYRISMIGEYLLTERYTEIVNRYRGRYCNILLDIQLEVIQKIINITMSIAGPMLNCDWLLALEKESIAEDVYNLISSCCLLIHRHCNLYTVLPDHFPNYSQLHHRLMCEPFSKVCHKLHSKYRKHAERGRLPCRNLDLLVFQNRLSNETTIASLLAATNERICASCDRVELVNTNFAFFNNCSHIFCYLCVEKLLYNDNDPRYEK